MWVAVLSGREKERLEKWLAALSEFERKGIRLVSMDMWKPYRAAVRAILPHANIVVEPRAKS